MRKIFFYLFLICIILFLYSHFIEIKSLKVNEYKLISNVEYEGLKIVHISDIHYGRIINKKQLKKVVDKVNYIKPDIVVFTGDFFSDIKYDNYLFDYLNEIQTSIGMYAIKGEFDSEKKWDELISKTGIIDVNNKTVELYYKGNKLLLSGLSTITDNIKTSKKISNLTIDNCYSILLVHEPDIIDDVDIKKYYLILAGHTHGGQIRLPFSTDGHRKINNTDIFISYGLGTKEYDLRLFDPPSFNLYRIYKN